MPTKERATIDYYVWLMSDWAYLGGVRFVQMAARHGMTINHIPMRMPDVYAGSGGVLLAQRSWQRQAYRIHELKRWSTRLGIRVNIEPRYFPTNIDLSSCMVIAAQRHGLPVADFVNGIMASIWSEDKDASDPNVLVALASGHGLDGGSLLAEAGTATVQAEYRDNTARALSAGVFGSPFYLFEGELFWGQDRLDMLEEAIIRSRSSDLGRRPAGCTGQTALRPVIQSGNRKHRLTLRQPAPSSVSRPPDAPPDRPPTVLCGSPERTRMVSKNRVRREA